MPGAKQAYPDWLQVVPWGLRRLLVWISIEYGNPPIYVTENGVGTSRKEDDDQGRVDFYTKYVDEALKGDVIIGV